MEHPSKYHQSEELLNQELAIIESAKKDISRFAPLYEKYYKPILLYIFQRVEDKDTAFDLTSQTFLKALSSIHNYSFKGLPFSSWLYRIAHNEMMEAFRKKNASRVVNIKEEYLKKLIEEEHSEGYEEHLPILLSSISKLPMDELQFIEMRFFEQRSYREIAEILSIKENNAKVKTHRILEKLKKQMKIKINLE